MATEEEILNEVEELGRLSQEQESILYNISLRQDELGRQPTNMLVEKLQNSPIYQPMIDREYITYEVFDYGNSDSPKVASLMVTLKGLRYCIVFGDDIEANLKLNPAGELRR